MPASPDVDTDELLLLANQGEPSAVQRLLERHRPRLRRMIELRLDKRLSAHVAPSDIVQDSLLDASRKLNDYLATRPLPFYPWLRAIAWQRLQDQYRRHMLAKRRSVKCEEPALPLPDQSAMLLASHFVDPGSSPSQRLLREESQRRIRDALDHLDPTDREILVLRHLEQMPVAEIASSQTRVSRRRSSWSEKPQRPSPPLGIMPNRKHWNSC
ncbi:MAG: sigma-70 family RNA polymerase sigma factor [Pirellulaceae bacterium]|jgi:RNA polymerase sigma-70 factor (ECF subfamily)|nr:sigma-70 family RNA polymerase sigma factor [Pirellulaceae bacterium]